MFEQYVGNSGRAWLFPAVTKMPNQADHIYATASADWNTPGTGFGGHTILLPLLSNGYFHLHGGWHGNADDLFEDTRIDIRARRLTYGAVALHRSNTGHELFGLLFADKSPQLGTKDRIIKIAQNLANKRKEKVYYSTLSAGGGASGWLEPEGR